MDTLDPLLAEGQLFTGKYRVERFLARGGMGAVYVAEHATTERRVALKVLFAHALASAKSRQSFELEARVANRVQSEHVVQVLDAGIDPATALPFLVMELLDGHDLDRHLADHGPMPPARAVACLRQVASALDRAHGYRDREGNPQPIIHRDLKPENLFLTRRESGEDCVKILDFGIAKVLGQQTSVTHEVRGTPLFMAPEQIQGQRVSAATDIWPLGLIAFQLLTGRSYWRAAEDDGATVMALFAEILSSPLGPPGQRVAERGGTAPWPPAFNAWFLRCVCRDPGGRFASAGEAVRELAAALGVEPGPATRVSLTPATGSPSTLASACAPALARSDLTTPRSDTASGGVLSRSLSPSSPPPSPGPGRPLALGALALALAGLAGALVFRSPPSSTAAGSAATATTAATTPTTDLPAPVPPSSVPSVVIASAVPTASSAPTALTLRPRATTGKPAHASTNAASSQASTPSPAPTAEHYDKR